MSLLLSLVSVSSLFDLALKSAVVMLLAVVAAVLLRRASAAWRHLVWCLGVTSLLLLPVLSLTLPAWKVTWLPQWPAERAEVVLTPSEMAPAERTGHIEFVPLDIDPAIVAPSSGDILATEPLPSLSVTSEADGRDSRLSLRESGDLSEMRNFRGDTM